MKKILICVGSFIFLLPNVVSANLSSSYVSDNVQYGGAHGFRTASSQHFTPSAEVRYVRLPSRASSRAVPYWFRLVDQCMYLLGVLWLMLRYGTNMTSREMLTLVWRLPLILCGAVLARLKRYSLLGQKPMASRGKVKKNIEQLYHSVRSISSMDCLHKVQDVLGDQLSKRVASELEIIKGQAVKKCVQIKKIRQVDLLYQLGSKSVLSVQADVLDYTYDEKGQIVSGTKQLKRVKDTLVLEKCANSNGKLIWRVRDMQVQA